jgi:steroid-24-oyl-CoA synthetase
MVQARTVTGYGLTENGGQATAATGRDTQERPGGLSRPLPCVDIKIADPGDGRDGEVLLRSPAPMTGYYGETASPIDAGGWLHTGDLGHLDEGGYLWITGRSKELIIRDFPLERMMRDAKIAQIHEGTNQIQHIVMALQLLAG